ncbi:RNA polymerase sigma factor SigF [Egibacter rhizosphaerae]|uniref:RNA polymerase sigma factor SigF n=1 Tax=Egibacter rhizosphaerae TaxID=1670831 RepID=A0A411YDC2_9ACTN|nr:RNA polymerase sigma factor SigF [Egibacter rhizosphaerae]QBI19178.1 RNA polymerase sigma factor SigF [Egibacter rhizosphaerae]
MSTQQYSREDTKMLFAKLQETGDPAIREELARLHLPLVEYLAKRFKDRGEPLDDLVQVGSVGLLKAIDRFDLDRGVEFSTYATPTIVGELKRYFRDKGWAIRVPRRLQELSLRLNKVVAQLTQDLGRSPTVAEIARAAEVSEEEVLEALESGQAYSTTSLDAPAGNDEEDTPMRLDRMGEEDVALDNLEYFASLAPLIEQLPEREREILYLRFFKGMTQSKIAEHVGISQMHVSRLLSRMLEFLRQGMEGEEPIG